MAKIVIKSGKFGIVVKELDTSSYQDEMLLIQDLLQAIPDADWFDGRRNGDSAGIDPINKSNKREGSGKPY